MTGFVYAFGAALFTATSDALCKQVLTRHTAMGIAWVRLAYSAPFLLPLLFVIDIPPLDATFWGIVALAVPMEVAALGCYMKALQISPLSLTVPFLSLTPVFSLLTSFLILGERPDRSGVGGICLIVAGAYLLNARHVKGGFFEPFRAIWTERGSFLMICVAFIYSITANLGKVAIQHSSPAFMGVCYVPMISLALLPFAFRSGLRPAHLRAGGPVFFLIGINQAAMALCHFAAVSMILVPYMISVKRLSLLLGVAFGKLFFKEKHLKERLLGSGLMVAGVVLILL